MATGRITQLNFEEATELIVSQIELAPAPETTPEK